MRRHRHLLRLAASLLLAAALQPQTQAQTLTQTTTVTKQAHDNPSIAIESFAGPEQQKAKLQELLIRSGWLKVLPPEQAAKAQIRLHANASTNALSGTLLLAGKSFPFSATADSEHLTLLNATDAILKTLFAIPPFVSRKITFVRQAANGTKELYACYLDGSGQERLTFNRAISTEPAWGHAGALVYTLAQNNALSVVLMDYHNKRQRVISRARGLNASAALSPDGRSVALALSRDGKVDLHVLDLASGASRKLTNDSSVESSPCWSPDGRQIAFVSDATGIGSPRLYIVPADGSAPARRLVTGGGEAVSPDWSRRNNLLVFATKSLGSYAIAVLDMSAPASKPEIVTAAAGDWEAPSWAPDGRHVICTRARAGKRDLVIVDTLTGSFRPITEGAILSLPAWQPAR